MRELSKSGRYGDGGGLYLSIAKAGSKSWVMRLRVDGKRTDKGLGGYPTVSLTAARKVADAYRVAVEEGRNPWSDDEWSGRTGAAGGSCVRRHGALSIADPPDMIKSRTFTLSIDMSSLTSWRSARR